ncbi:TRAP-type mannitol/chloroaromatic compound transport system permease large subunit [Kitasatospora sp. GAS204A]|uniref:hypothetical protein n=1 Tax=unclassified Kitasatospora TaxID=2633591 RepID=UPI0024767B2C|nr:hypothetical protein [Kitasatospora sp. GAS204B]MDH6118529.1 TRAP-type mannitol/chloroaromatic compound transport system permease large subunit [Kitasatospora sp. GAS204B]
MNDHVRTRRPVAGRLAAGSAPALLLLVAVLGGILGGTGAPGGAAGPGAGAGAGVAPVGTGRLLADSCYTAPGQLESEYNGTGASCGPGWAQI